MFRLEATSRKVTNPKGLLIRVLGFGGSTSRISRCISAYPAATSSSLLNGVVPVSSRKEQQRPGCTRRSECRCRARSFPPAQGLM